MLYQKSVAERERVLALELAKTKENILENISHEFRTPLTLISGPVGLLRKKRVDTDDLKSLAMIERSAQSLLAMVEQLLSMAKLSWNEEETFYPTQVKASYEPILQAFSDIAENNKVHFRLLGDIDRDWWVSAPEHGLETVLTNLLSNAIKYTPQGQSIEVMFQKTGSNKENANQTGPL